MRTSSDVFEVEEREGILFLRITHNKVLYEEQIQKMREELKVAAQAQVRGYCMDWAHVEYWSSAAFSVLMNFHHNVVGTQQKRLVLHSIRPDVYESFVITRLNKLFWIEHTEEEALRLLGYNPRLPAA